MTSPTGPPIRKHFAAKLPIFYGWLMVPVAVVATAVTGVGQTYGISVFNPSLLDSLGISLTALSGAYLVGTLLASLPQPLIGALMDRLGIRSTMLGVVLLLGLACIFFARVNSLLTLFLGFFFLRLLGQGGLSLLAGNIPAMWFREKLGTATGIVSGGFSVSMAVIPAYFLSLVNNIGWRGAYTRLGFLVWLIMVPILLLVFKNNPAEIDQELDGGDRRTDGELNPGPDADYSVPVKQARSTPAYWIMMLSSSLWAMIVTAVFFNLLSIFDGLGISPGVAAATYTTYAAAALITQLLLGSLANRGPLQYLLMACLGFLAAGIAVLTVATSPMIAHGYAALIGISTGLISLVGGTMFARYFGRAHLGKLRGGVLTAQVAGSSLGPFITGLIYDLTGSFQISLWIFVGILIPAALLSLKAVQPPPGTLARAGE
jgi:OFA family oxalate/formate antiporter-like MFS transporter